MNIIPFPLRLDLKLWWEYAAPGECHYTLSMVSFSWGLKHRNVWNFKIPGHFFVRSTDLLSLPNVNPDSAFGMQVQREHINYKISQFLWNMEFFMICVGVDRRGPQRLTRGEFSSILVSNLRLFGTTTDQILTLMLCRWAFRQLCCTRRARERGE